MTSPPASGSNQVRAIDRVADALTAGGHKYQRRGNHIQASCPLHTDNDPSLSIDQGDRGTGPGALMNCHSNQGCTERDITEALDLRYDELWDQPLPMCPVCGKPTKQDVESGEWIHPYCAGKRDGRKIPRDHIQRRPAVKARAKIGRLPARIVAGPAETVVEPEQKVAEYDHVNDDGEVVARSIRMEKWVRVDGTDQPQKSKRFYQLFANGQGGWSRSKKDLPAGGIVPLYRLPELRLSILAGLSVYLVEGHKDADAIVAAGGEATTNIDGAKNLHRDDTDQLAGADVIIVCDRDLAGYQRGLTALELLDGVAESVEVMLPATIEPKSDAHDHLHAGYGLDEFVETSKEELQRLVILEQAEAILRDVEGMPAEILAQEDRAEAAENEDERSEAHKAADRWSLEIARKQFQDKLVPLRDELIKITGCTREEVRRLDAVIAQVRRFAVEAYGRRQLVADHALSELLGLVDHDIDEVSDRPDDPPNNVVDFPQAGYRAREPAHRIPMATAIEYAYSLGDDGFERGIWMATKNTPWMKLADLPYVHRRVIRRDGRGKRTGLHYQLSAGPGDRPLQFDLSALKDGTWANHLGVELSQDQKVIQAVATAIIYAGADAPEHEATPDLDRETGKIVIPASIDQYFECAPVPVDEALETWRDIVVELVDAPKMALAVGASAIAPFVHSLSDSHTVSMTGEPGQGKSITLRLAAGVWGDSVNGNGSLYSSWNATGQGLPRLLGTLRVLPVFRDETGLAGQSPDYWAKLVYQISEGIDRLRYDRMTDYTMDKPWWGILFSTGNEEFADGCNSGRFQGVPRRLVNLSGPFTLSKEHGERIHRSKAPIGRRGLLERCYGHLGVQIAERVDAVHAIDLLDKAAGTLDCPERARLIGPLLELHVAGAMIVDEILGTGDLLTKSAAVAAQDYLDSWKPPAREADQVIELLLDAIGREPSAWPTVAEYAEHLLPYSHIDGNDSRHIQLPQSGVSRNLFGVIADDGSWVGVFSTAWKELFPPEEINRRLACRQLASDRILRVQESRRRRDEYVNEIRVSDLSSPGKATARLYQFYLPITGPLEHADSSSDSGDDEVSAQPTLTDQTGPVAPDVADHESGESGDAAGPAVGGLVAGSCGSVAGTVAGIDDALTRGVAGVAGLPANTSRSVCARGENSGDDGPATVLVHAEGPVELDPERASGTYTDITGTVRQKDWARTGGPCEVCGRTCVIVIAGHRVHLPCWDNRVRTAAGQSDTAPATPTPVPTPQTRTTPQSPRQAPAAAPAAPTSATTDRAQAYTAPAVVVDTDGVHLPGGRLEPLPTIRHLGDLAALVETYRLGWGSDRRPDLGQVWISDAIAEQLGLPIDIPDPEDERQEFLAKASGLPAYIDAIEAGWQGSARGMSPWTRLWRPNQPGSGAFVVVSSWQARDAMQLGEDRDPATLVDELLAYAKALSIAYRISPAATGVDLIPVSRAKARIKITEPIQIPELGQSKIIERDLRWTRQFSRAETERLWLHGYDHNGAYPAVAGNLAVGLGQPRHVEGEAARQAFDGKRPGIWSAVVDDWHVTDHGQRLFPWAGMPDPAEPTNRERQDGQRRWLTTPTLAFLAEMEHPFTIVSGIVFDDHTRYLDQWAKTVREARKLYQGGHVSQRVWDAIKATYAAAHGRMSMTARKGEVWYRPDVDASWIAAAKVSTFRRILQIGNDTGTWPVAAITDTIFYLSDEPDPVKAWPGKRDHLGLDTMQQWKPYGSLNMTEPVTVKGKETTVRALIESGKFGVASVEMINPAELITGE